MATEQTYVLDGPTDFFFPFPVRTPGQLVVSVEPGGVLPPASYEVIGASATATGVTVRYADAPRDGLSTLRIARRTEPLRVSQFLDDLSITARALNAEFDNILQLVQDGVINEFRGPWETERLYLVLDVVVGPDDNIYVCLEQHESDDFNTDLGDGKWLLAADFSTGQANIDAALQAAEAARDKAEQWAEEDEDVEVEPGEFSAKHHAIKSADSAAAALVSEQNAAPVNAIVAEIATVAGIEQEVIDVAGNEADISTVAGINANVTTVATNNANVTIVATNIADVNTVAASISQVQDVAAIDQAVVSVAAIDSQVVTVAGIDGDVTTVAGISSDVTTVAQFPDEVQTVALDLTGGTFDPSKVYDLGSVTDPAQGLSAAPDGFIVTVFNNLGDIITVADNIADIGTVTTNINSVNTIVANLTEILDVEANLGAINTTATNIQAIIDAPQAASDAEAARDKAQLWAQEDEDVEVEPGEFSAFHWAQKAQGFAQGAAINISYDNTTSGLTADDVQAAIDELVQIKAKLDGGNNFTGNQTIDGDVTITGTLDCGSIA